MQSQQQLLTESRRIDVERFLDNQAAWRDSRDLIDMNGRKCGNRQYSYLKKYGNGIRIYRNRKTLNAAKNRANLANGHPKPV